MPKPRVSLAIVASFVTIGMLAGCQPVPPHPSARHTATPPVRRTATPAPASTPSPTPTPTVDSITVTSHDIGVVDTAGRQVADFPFATSLDAAAIGLGHAIGIAPTVTPVAATSCADATSIYTWPGFTMYAKPDGVTFGGDFIIDMTASHTDHNIGLSGPYGQSVGGSLAHLRTADPGVVTGAVGDGTSEAILDSQEDDFWGVIVAFDASGTATDMQSPGFYLTGYDTC